MAKVEVCLCPSAKLQHVHRPCNFYYHFSLGQNTKNLFQNYMRILRQCPWLNSIPRYHQSTTLLMCQTLLAGHNWPTNWGHLVNKIFIINIRLRLIMFTAKYLLQSYINKFIYKVNNSNNNKMVYNLI